MSETVPPPNHIQDNSTARIPIYFIPSTDNAYVPASYYLKLLFQFKIMIFLITALCMLAAVSLTFLIEPLFRAEVLLLPPKVTKGKLSANKFVLGLFPGIDFLNSQQRHNILLHIVSRSFLLYFIEKEQLLPILFPELWDKQAKTWRLSKPDQQPPRPRHGYGLLRNALSIRSDNNINTIVIEWRNPQEAAWLANHLVEQLDLYLKNKEISRIQNNIQKLQKKLNVDTLKMTELKSLIVHLLEVQYKQLTVADIQNEQFFEILDKAIAPDDGAHFYPNVKMFALIGGTLGFILSIVAVFVIKLAFYSRRGHEKKND